jgi:hypothetical protein
VFGTPETNKYLDPVEKEALELQSLILMLL